MGNKHSQARKNEINGQIDVSRMKDVNLSNEWFRGSPNQAIGVTKLMDPLFDEFELSWLIEDWPSVCESMQKLQFPEFRGGPNHLWSLELKINKEEGYMIVDLILQEIDGSSEDLECAFSSTVFANGAITKGLKQLQVYEKLKIGQYFRERWNADSGKYVFKNDSIRFHFTVRVKKSQVNPDPVKHTLMTSQRRSLMSPKSSRALTSSNLLARDFGNLFQSKNFSDLTLVVGHVEIPTHKLILSARSPVFGAMFATQMAEYAEGRVVIEDFGPEVVTAMLGYLYTGKTEVKGVSMEDLLLLSDKYQLPELVTECESVLISKISILNAAQLLKLAHLVTTAQSLRKRSIQFMKRNIEKVSKTQGYEELVKSYPELLTETPRSTLLWKN